ncbi:methyl-accepting chemotaxis protein [Paenibacillus alba]|uniref:methyl-accepting chemotaxis protein n=1 Tax=Paenibacillus alba TaxID=1197127 RepID=UPI001566A4D8|nr:methyl-accepting chemotaxis protein [Paenibacillus alba]NQX69160.1 methyl-accepting chemotaxis protein [Paenibacillus alba]
MGKKISMSFFTKNLLLSSFNIFLIGVLLIVSSYFIQKKILINQLHNQIQTVTETWFKQLDSSKVQTAMKEKSFKGPVQTELRALMDDISKYNPTIAQAYIFGTELQDGNKTSLGVVPTHLIQPLEEAKLTIGDMYEQPPVIAKTVKNMLGSKVETFSDVYADDYGTWTTITYPIKDQSGAIYAYFAVDTDARAIPEGLNKLLIYGLTILIVSLIVIITVQYFIVRRTLSPIRELIRGIEQVSAGNLDVELRTGTDDLGTINKKFNHMVSTMNNTIVKVQELSVHVAESAKGLYTTTEKNNLHAETINSHIKMITGNIQHQEQSSMESSRAISEITSVIQTIAHSSSTVADEVNDVETKSVQGDIVVKSMVEQMALINQFVHATSETVRLLDRRSQEIGNILGVITGIASQTNMLALNAAIEASRVGEHGRGFAVVAGEVRKLAEQSNQSADQISSLIKEVQTEIHQASQSINEGTHVVEKGVVMAEETGHLFTDILNATKNVSAQIQDVSSAAQEISAGTEQISANADELSVAVSKTATNASEISHSIDEQKHHLESIVQSSNVLSATAEDLKELIKQFKVKKL